MVYYSIVPKGNKQTNVSEYAAQVWSELERDGAVRHAFEKLADEEKAEHSRLHPNYRYIPPRAGDDGGLRNGRTSEPNAPIAVPQQSVPTPPQRHPSGRIRETPEPTSEGHNDFHGSGAYFYQPPHTHDEDEDEYYYDLTQELEDDTYHPASPSFRHAPQARIVSKQVLYCHNSTDETFSHNVVLREDNLLSMGRENPNQGHLRISLRDIILLHIIIRCQ